MEWLVAALMAGVILANGGAHVLIKVGMRQHPDLLSNGAVNAARDILLNPFAVSGIAAYSASFVLYAALLSKMDLSIAYPLCTSTSFLLVLWMSRLLFSERFNPARIAGIALILCGIILVAVDM